MNDLMNNSLTIKQRVLAKIESGEVAMRSRAYFAARVALVAVLIALAVLVAVFVVSFALYSVRASGHALLLGFGAQGVATFFALFPWFTLALLVALLAAIEALVRRFKLGYRTPVLVALSGALLGALLLGFALAETPLHDALMREADRGELPILGGLYEGVHTPHEQAGIYRGVVGEIRADGFFIAHDDGDRDTDDGTWYVEPPPGFDLSRVQPGERVFVAGAPVARGAAMSEAGTAPAASGTVKAYGIEAFAR